MNLKINLYDTLDQSIKTIDKSSLKIYACGVTVYDDIHIGHARLYSCIDIFLRLLTHLNIEYKYVRNITDVDDKIIKKANATNGNIIEVTEKYAKKMHECFDKMHLLSPDSEPKASHSIKEILELINTLLELIDILSKLIDILLEFI